MVEYPQLSDFFRKKFPILFPKKPAMKTFLTFSQKSFSCISKKTQVQKNKKAHPEKISYLSKNAIF